MVARIQLVGSIAVITEQGTVAGAALAARRVRLVLAALATAPNGLSSEALAARVWEELPSTWSAALRGTIRSLRTALEPLGLGGQELVRTTSGGWSIAPGVEVDLLDAAEVVAGAETLLADGEAEPAMAAVDGLFTRLGGELLPGEDAAWLAELRDRLAAVTDRVLVVEAEAALLLERTAAAAEAARQLLARNGLDERAHRVLIRALAASGDRAAAIRAYEDCRAVLAEELGMDPGPAVTTAYLEVLRSGSSGSGTLPALPRNGFFGRRAELDAIATALLEPGVVTVLGRGGVGKTRLALTAAHAVAAELPGGCFWVSLGDLPGDGLVAATVARSIRAEEGADPLAATITRLAPLGSALLVLDGSEAVADGVAELVDVLVGVAPALRILVTSRHALNLPDERTIGLAPLSIPSAPDAVLSNNAAVQLLTDRLAAQGQPLGTGAWNADAVRELCARCGGMPLALELAAAQLASMAVADLLDLLPVATRDAEEVIDSLVDQSYEMLGSEAATLFRAWGAVDGELSLSFATKLVDSAAVPRDGGGGSPGRTARVLGELTAAGLLSVDRSGPRWRYRQDDQIRRFARRRLDQSAGAAGVYERLAGGLRGILPEDVRTPPAGFRDAVTEASDVFRTLFVAAIDGVIDREVGLELAFRLHRYWTVTGLAEGRYWLTRLVDDSSPSAARESNWHALALFAAGYLAYWAGDTDPAQSLLEEAAARLRGIEDSFAVRAVFYAAAIADDHDRPVDALRDVRLAVELAEQAGDPALLVSAISGIASILAERGDPSAVEYADRSIALGREQGGEDQLLSVIGTAALIAWRVGNFDRARALILEAEPLFAGDARISRTLLASAAAGMALLDDRLDAAARLAEIAISDGVEVGVDHELPLAHALASRIAARRGRESDAVASALAAITIAEGLDFDYPMAVSLEAAAELVGDDGQATLIRAVASGIRDRGDRPAPVGLRPSVSVPASASTASIADAVATARAALEP